MDFLSSLETGVPFALALIVIMMFVLLFLMLGSLIVPLKAVVLNVLSLSASFGAIVWIFQDGNLSGHAQASRPQVTSTARCPC